MATSDPAVAALDWPLTLAPPSDETRRRDWWRKIGAPAMSGDPMASR